MLDGGVGVAPMLSVVRQMAAAEDARPAILVYGNRTREQIVHKDELDRLAAERPFRPIYVLSEPPADWHGATGMLDADAVEAAFQAGATQEWHYLLCGPPGMLEAVERALLARGVPSGRILAERFRYD
jgi:ferredoxin-NADP reductase